MTIIIEKGIQVPERGKFAFLKEMVPLDSVFIPIGEYKNRQALAASVGVYARRYFGRGNYTTRWGDGGLRLWRLK